MAVLLSQVGCAFLEASTAPVMTLREELQVGQFLASHLEASLSLHEDQGLQRYIQALGDKLLQRAEVPEGMIFRFRVIDDASSYRAMALPGGWVYVTSGLLMLTETEAELAGVLGHEIAHVLERHLPERLSALHSLEEVEKWLNTQGALPGVASEVGEQIANAWMLNFGRTQESVADAVGLSLVINAGYNPERFIDFLERLEALESDAGPSWASTHPGAVNRQESIRRLIASQTDIADYDGGDAFEDAQVRLWGPSGRPQF